MPTDGKVRITDLIQRQQELVSKLQEECIDTPAEDLATLQERLGLLDIAVRDLSTLNDSWRA